MTKRKHKKSKQFCFLVLMFMFSDYSIRRMSVFVLLIRSCMFIPMLVLVLVLVPVLVHVLVHVLVLLKSSLKID